MIDTFIVARGGRDATFLVLVYRASHCGEVSASPSISTFAPPPQKRAQQRLRGVATRGVMRIARPIHFPGLVVGHFALYRWSAEAAPLSAAASPSPCATSALPWSEVGHVPLDVGPVERRCRVTVSGLVKPLTRKSFICPDSTNSNILLLFSMYT